MLEQGHPRQFLTDRRTLWDREWACCTRYIKELAIVALLLGWLQPSLIAATYYVTKTGNNNNPGSQTLPWLTIQKAATTMMAGDTVIVGNGTYAEVVQTTRAGTNGNPITFQGSGQTIVGSFGIFHDWINVDKFRFTEYPLIYGSITFTGSNIRITNNVIYSSHHIGIRTVTSSGAIPAPGNWPSNVYIGYNQLTGIDTAGQTISFNGNSSTIEQNTFDSNACDTITLWGDNNIIRKNTVKNTQRDLIGLGQGNENHNDFIQTFHKTNYHARNNLIESNFIKDNYFQLCNLSDDGFQSDFNNWTFRNNVFINNTFNGNPGIPNCKWYNNTFYHSPYSDGSYTPIVFFDNSNFHSAGGIIKNNLFVNCGYETPDFKLGFYSVGYEADYNLVVCMLPTCATTRSAPNFSEVHGLNGVDPLFVDAANGDLRLRPGSPAIGAGLALNGLFTTDFDGVVRGSTWDIGAFQRVGSTVPSAPTNLRIVP